PLLCHILHIRLREKIPVRRDYHVRRKPFIRNNLHKVEHGMIQYSAIIPCVIKKESYCSITFRPTFAR
ncbi:MAG TPA: hypothetical protein VIW25_10445, partial [Nitrososphaeraceae archaeon]